MSNQLGRANQDKKSKKFKFFCDYHLDSNSRLHLAALKNKIESNLYDNNEDCYNKWQKKLNSYMKAKATSWKLKMNSKEEIIVCRICEKKFGEAIFKAHSAECYELSDWNHELKKKNLEIIKACETAFEKKQELSVNAVIEK